MASPGKQVPTLRRASARAADALRPVAFELDPLKFAEGSALVHFGDTQVLVAASLENRVPPFRIDSGLGWVTAEYAMLPRATQTRNPREVSRGRPSGRTAEIQRLIGRALRSVVDMSALGEITVTVDCDVLQADGGTRTAAITGGYVAMVQALGRAFLQGDLASWPILDELAAVSVGICDGTPVLDLDYREDRGAAVDMNVVATGSGGLVEVQGTAERGSIGRELFDGLLDLALSGITELASQQRRVLAPMLDEVEARRHRGSRRQAKAKSEDELWGPPK